MSDEMLNKTKPYNKSSGLQGIGDTIEAMNHYDMNYLVDSIHAKDRDKVSPAKYNKNS